MARRCFLIVNPTSGSYSRQSVERIMARLAAAGLDPQFLATGSGEDATLFAGRICAEHLDPLILVAGGDGTVNGVLNGLVPGAATLGVIPVGTSNVLARELEIDSVDDALKRVVAGRTRPVPVGEVRLDGETRRFLLMAGVGVDGAVVRDVRLGEKRAFGKGAYLLAALRLLFFWDESLVQVTGGGRSVACHSVIVSNAAKYGGNFVLAPGGDLFSPGLQVACIGGGRFAYLAHALRLVLGNFSASRLVEIFTAEELEVTGEKAVQLDGDFFGLAPAHFRSIPDFLRMIV